MNRHTSELYRLADLPAFIKEALSNVELDEIVSAYLCRFPSELRDEIESASLQYAEQWVDDWMDRNQSPLFDSSNRDDDPEIRAIEAGVKLFSNPDCKAGLPE